MTNDMNENSSNDDTKIVSIQNESENGGNGGVVSQSRRVQRQRESDARSNNPPPQGSARTQYTISGRSDQRHDYQTGRGVSAPQAPPHQSNGFNFGVRSGGLGDRLQHINITGALARYDQGIQWINNLPYRFETWSLDHPIGGPLTDVIAGAVSLVSLYTSTMTAIQPYDELMMISMSSDMIIPMLKQSIKNADNKYSKSEIDKMYSILDHVDNAVNSLQMVAAGFTLLYFVTVDDTVRTATKGIANFGASLAIGLGAPDMATELYALSESIPAPSGQITLPYLITSLTFWKHGHKEKGLPNQGGYAQQKLPPY